MDEAARNGTVLASDEVLQELKRKKDGAHDGAKAHPELLVGLDSEVEEHVRHIMRNYPRLVDTKKGRSVGDTFVIAVARVRKLTVITAENATGKRDVPRIPDVCDDLAIPCIRILYFFRGQTWRA